MLLFTDGVLDTASPDDTPFDAHRIATFLNDGDNGSCGDLARRLLAALHGHAASDELGHDDVSFLLAEFEEAPPGPALVACLQASRVAPGAAVTCLPRGSWRRHPRDERLITRRS